MSVDVSELLSAFAKRRCAVCGEPARVFSPGDDGERIGGVAWRPNRRPRPDLNLCLQHAMSVGWPWESENAEPARASVAL